MMSLPSIYGLSSSASMYKDTRLLLKFSPYSSGTTIWLTKLAHQALVCPGLTQNRRDRA